MNSVKALKEVVILVVVVVVVVSSSSRNEYYLGGTIALLLQDHRTMSTKLVCSSLRIRLNPTRFTSLYYTVYNKHKIHIHKMNLSALKWAQ